MGGDCKEGFGKRLAGLVGCAVLGEMRLRVHLITPIQVLAIPPGVYAKYISHNVSFTRQYDKYT
jgi:hypothetical protein